MATEQGRPKLGRPSSYTEEQADEICRRIALGEAVIAICREDGMPSQDTIFEWRRKYETFAEKYTRAKEDQAETFEERMLQVANTEADVQRARLIVDTMKWTASKLKPKKYGDKLDVTSDGKVLPQPIYGGLSVPKNDTQDDQN